PATTRSASSPWMCKPGGASSTSPSVTRSSAAPSARAGTSSGRGISVSRTSPNTLYRWPSSAKRAAPHCGGEFGRREDPEQLHPVAVDDRPLLPAFGRPAPRLGLEEVEIDHRPGMPLFRHRLRCGLHIVSLDLLIPVRHLITAKPLVEHRLRHPPGEGAPKRRPPNARIQ